MAKFNKATQKKIQPDLEEFTKEIQDVIKKYNAFNGLTLGAIQFASEESLLNCPCGTEPFIENGKVKIRCKICPPTNAVTN